MAKKLKPEARLMAQRLDRWLWAARFYKTRSLAAAAVRGGKVACNGVRSKPSRMLKAGDQLEISRAGQRLSITVGALASRRGPAAEAAQLYQESDASISRREAEQEIRRIDRASQSDYGKRPDKRSRRLIRRFTGKDE